MTNTLVRRLGENYIYYLQKLPLTTAETTFLQQLN